MRTIYDEGEAQCPGDPTLNDIDPKQLLKLQREYDKISKIENPIARAKAVSKLMRQLNG